MFDIWQIGHLDSVRGRANAAGLDEVIGVFVQAEKEEFESLSPVREHG